MNTKEIKIVYSSDNTASFYRMEGARWCLIADSDDSLRPYIQEEMGSDAWNKNFFAACRQAAFAAEEDRLVIWFEGSAEDYSDFRESLDDCALDEDIRVKRIKTEPQEPIPEENSDVDELETETEEIHEDDIVSEVVEDESALVTDDSASDTIEDVDEEKVNEKTGILEYPGEGAWSWRKKYPEVPAEEKETLRIDKNTIIDREMTLVNKTIVVAASVGLTVKVECIHCTICIEQNAGVDIVKDAALWLKHCVIKGLAPEKQWLPIEVRDALAVVNGELHIYDSVVHHLEIEDADILEGYAIENFGTCHIVDTKIQYFKGKYIMNGGAFCGSRISTTHFGGMLIGAFSESEIQRLEHCYFRFSYFDGKNGEKYCPFIYLCNGDIYSCDFVQTDNNRYLNLSGIVIRDIHVQNSTFNTVGKLLTNGSVFEECKFVKCGSIHVSHRVPTLSEFVKFKKCDFVNGIVFEDSVICTRDTYKQVSYLIEECTFYRCICKNVLEFSCEKETKRNGTYIIKNSIFRECIASEALICGKIDKNMRKEKNDFRVEGNKFYSCICKKYVESKASYGLGRKPCNLFLQKGNEKIEILLPWTEAMMAARCEEDAEEIERKLKEKDRRLNKKVTLQAPKV